MALGKPRCWAKSRSAISKVGDDGWFDLIVGGPAGPHQLDCSADANSSYLNIRQFVGDWEHDPIAVLDIERLDDVGVACDQCHPGINGRGP